MISPPPLSESMPLDLASIGRQAARHALVVGEQRAFEAAVAAMLGSVSPQTAEALNKFAALVGEHLARTNAALRSLQQQAYETRRLREERLRIDPLPAIAARHGFALSRLDRYQVAVHDGAFVGRGWYPLEADAFGHWRWAGLSPLSSILLPSLGGGTLEVTLALRLPFGIRLLECGAIDVMADGVDVECVDIQDSRWIGKVTLPSDDTTTRMCLVLASRRFRDPQVTAERDPRELGVGLMSVDVRKIHRP
jgi:hypothetical protein